MAVNKKNLRYCQVLYLGTYYDIFVAVTDLDEIDQILQDWALNKFNVELDLPAALILNKAITEVVTALDVDEYVYIDSPVSAYMELPRFAGISGTFPVLPGALDLEGFYVLPEVTAFLWSAVGQSGYFGEYIVPISQDFTLSAGINYIGITFNAGVPIYQLYTAWSSFDFSTTFPVVTVLSFGGSVYEIPFGNTGDGLPEKLIGAMTRKKSFEILDEYIMVNSGLYAELGAVVVGHGTDELTCLAMDTETTGHDMYFYSKNSSGVWSAAKVATINNTQYQTSATGLDTLAGGEFVINYLFRVVDEAKRLMFYVLSNKFATLQAAINAPEITGIPEAITGSAVCVGRMIIEQGSSAPTVQLVRKTIFG